MKDLLDQIEASLGTKQYYPPLIAALAIPDIAGALEAANGQATGKRYAAWFEKWVRPELNETVQAMLPAHAKGLGITVNNPLTGDDCYRFRCSMLHQATTQHPHSTFSRILFLEPGSTSNVLHYNIMNDALNIDLPSFVREMVRGARKWIATVAGTEPFETNLRKGIQRYPNGLPPYIAGVPVIG